MMRTNLFPDHDGADTARRALIGYGWVLLSVLGGTVVFVIAKALLVVQTQADCCYWWFGFALLYYVVWLVMSGNRLTGCLCREYIGWIILFAACEITGTVFFFRGLHLIDPSLVSFLQRSQTVFVPVLGIIFLEERFSAPEYLGGAVILTGTVMIAAQSGELNVAGIVMVLLSTLAHSVSVIIVRRSGNAVGTHSFALIRTVSLLLFYLIYAGATPGSFGIPSAGRLATIAAGAFFGPFMLVVSSYKALEYLEAGKTALARTAQPFFVMMVSFILFGMVPGMRSIAGGVLIVGGNAVMILSAIKTGRRVTPVSLQK